MLSFLNENLNSVQNRPAIRLLRTSPAARGLEEFFPPGCVEKGELAPETVKTGNKKKTKKNLVSL